MAAVGVRTMMSAAREEAAIISSEMAVAARTAVVEGGAVERVVSPIGVRQAAEAGVKEAENALSQHLSLARSQLPMPSSTIQTTLTSVQITTSSTSTTASIGTTRTVVAQALEQDLGVTLKEVMSNATQTGVEEQMDELVDVAKKLAAAA